jgi:hypothetical protein
MLRQLLPPFWLNPDRRLDRSGGGKQGPGGKFCLPGKLSPCPEDTTGFRLGLADPPRNRRAVPRATRMTAAQGKGPSPVGPWAIRNDTGSPGLSSCPGLPRGFAFGPSTLGRRGRPRGLGEPIVRQRRPVHVATEVFKPRPTAIPAKGGIAGRRARGIRRSGAGVFTNGSWRRHPSRSRPMRLCDRPVGNRDGAGVG